MTIDDSFRLFM